MEHNILPPFPDKSSRKRKPRDADEWGIVSEIELGYGLSRHSNLLHKMNARSRIGDGGNPPGLLLDPKCQAVESVSSRHRLENDQFQTQNCFSSTLLSNSGTQKISKSSTSVLPKSFHYVGPFSTNKIPDGETLTVSNGPPLAYDLFSQAERLLLPILEFSGTQARKAGVDPGLQDIVSLGYKNSVVSDKQLVKVQYSLPEMLRSSEPLYQSFVDDHECPESLEGKACLPETRKCESVLKQNEQNLNNAGLSAATDSLGLCAQIEHTENDKTLQNETPVGGATQDQNPSNNVREDDEGHRDGSIQMKKNTKGSHSNSSLVESIPSKTGGNQPNSAVGNYGRSEKSCKLSDEKSVQFAGKLASTIADKLWDGSLQLNSSITVSAVAFFKSGEKMPNIRWPELVEVKGKVRLEAFEKYIQDLSHSRNRGLMVISLCWKECSSKSGLVGMKKVAKGYKEGKRVGIVQLSPGIDLYVCPRSDTIITILAKHGFFKGMAAVVDNQDSLIGCVVWRRNGAASTHSATKKSERKNCTPLEQLRHCSSASSAQKSAGKDLSCSQPSQELIPVALETESTIFKSAGNSRNEGKRLKTSEVQLELKNCSASANPSLTSSVLGPQTLKCSNSASLQGSMSQPSEAEAALIHKSSVKRSEPSLGLQNPIMSLPFEITKYTTLSPDDDDLPEFDFGTASGISYQMSKSLDVATAGKTLLTEGLRKMDGLLQPTVQTAHSQSAFNQFNLPRLPLDAIQRMSSLKKAYECKKETNQSRGIMVPVNAATSKNLFDDDDDMPEWCPPKVELHKQLVAPTTLASTTLVPSKVRHSTFDRFSPRYPNRMAVGHTTTAQASAHANCCSMDVTTKVVHPTSRERFVQRDPNSSIVFSANPPVRSPPDAFAVKDTVRLGGWRGWKP